MKQILLAVVCGAILFSSCGGGSEKKGEPATTSADSGDTSTTPSTDTGWVSLFDGSSLKGWHTYGQTVAGKAWKADSGTIHLDASNKKDWQTIDGGDIVTNEEFSNFHLKLEWKISIGGNSGVIFYVQDDPSKYEYAWRTGPEMQVLDDERHDDRKTPSHRAGSLYDMIQATPGAVKPAGEWNTAEIISNNGKLHFYLNGVNTVSTTLWDDNWKKMVAASKFHEWPYFGTFKSGHLALQDHGNDVWFRNIMIKKL